MTENKPVSADSGLPPRGRWLHAHLRTCPVQGWFQSGEDGEPPACVCDTTPGAIAGGEGK